MPLNLLRLKGEFLKIVLKLSSVNSSHCEVEKLSIAGMGEKLISVVGLLNLFHGQTSWHVSQPNIQLSNLPFILSSIKASFNSIV
jgi:hypothetical protein